MKDVMHKFETFLKSLHQEEDDLATDDSSIREYDMGEIYLVQTNTLWLFSGECECDGRDFVTFKNVSWIQEMGRLSEFMRNSGGIAHYSEHMGECRLRISKAHIVFDVALKNALHGSYKNGNLENP